MRMLAEAGREFWRGVLVAGGFAAIPRWALDPAPGIGEHEATISDDLVAACRRLAKELGMPLSSVLLAAHAKVLAALSGEHEVATGYVAVEGGQPLPCRLTTEPASWRTLLLDTHRVESELLLHKDFPVDDLKRRAGPDRTVVRDRVRSDRRRPRFRRGHRAAGGDLATRRPTHAAAAVPERGD